MMYYIYLADELIVDASAGLADLEFFFQFVQIVGDVGIRHAQEFFDFVVVCSFSLAMF